MDRTTIDWTGAIPAITTAFARDGGIDHTAMTRNIRRLMDAGATGVVAAGCTGEFWSLTEAERAAVYRSTAEAVGPDGAKIVGCAAITPDGAVEAMHAAKEAGCDAGLVLPPYFVHLSRSELIAHFEAVAAKAPLPMVLYNIPGNAWNALTPEVVDVLADLDPVVAIKESSGDWVNFHRTLDIARDRIRVFCGPSSTIGMPAILAGADGLIDCFPNVWTGCIDLWAKAKAGDMDEAWRLQAIGQALTELFTSDGRTLYPATKAAMDHLGLPGGGRPRAPLAPLEGAALRDLCDGLDHLLDPRADSAA
jgi:4-hydroxy-tetrahydrodipicolinate synthase